MHSSISNYLATDFNSSTYKQLLIGIFILDARANGLIKGPPGLDQLIDISFYKMIACDGEIRKLMAHLCRCDCLARKFKVSLTGFPIFDKVWPFILYVVYIETNS